jgi:hypothetical protein
MTPEQKKLVRILVLVAVVDLLVAAGGVFIWLRYYRSLELPGTKERAALAAQLLNLSAAVEGSFSTLTAAPARDEAAILKLATEHDPSLLAPFADKRLRVQYQRNHAVLLLCTKDGRQALLEDLGCTARLDRQVREDENAPCEFTLKAETGCAVPATP